MYYVIFKLKSEGIRNSDLDIRKKNLHIDKIQQQKV